MSDDNERSVASAGSIPWSRYDEDTLATGVKALAESMHRLGNIDEDLFLSVMTYAFFLGKGVEPSAVTEMPDELELFLNEAFKARKECAMSHLLVSGFMTTVSSNDGSPRFVPAVGAKQWMANELQADGDTPRTLA